MKYENVELLNKIKAGLNDLTAEQASDLLNEIENARFILQMKDMWSRTDYQIDDLMWDIIKSLKTRVGA